MSDVMTLDELRADVRYWQTLLRFAGYDCGAVDGIRGKKTKAAEELWFGDAKRYCLDYGGVFDERTERNLATLIPEAQRCVRAWFTRARSVAAALEYELKIIEGTRSYARQNELYAQGRTKKGAKVTNAKGGGSWHNFGLACDFGLFRGKTYLEDGKAYITVGQLANAIPGLEWGGSWRTLKDYPHIQLNRYGSVAQAKQAFNSIA